MLRLRRFLIATAVTSSILLVWFLADTVTLGFQTKPLSEVVNDSVFNPNDLIAPLTPSPPVITVDTSRNPPTTTTTPGTSSTQPGIVAPSSPDSRRTTTGSSPSQQTTTQPQTVDGPPSSTATTSITEPTSRGDEGDSSDRDIPESAERAK